MNFLGRVWWTIQWGTILSIPLLLVWGMLGALTPWRVLGSLVVPMLVLELTTVLKERSKRKS